MKKSPIIRAIEQGRRDKHKIIEPFFKLLREQPVKVTVLKEKK
jgi:hypothetical protein